jgi:hypothetical protein
MSAASFGAFGQRLFADGVKILFARDRNAAAQVEQGLRDGFDDDLIAIHDKRDLVALVRFHAAADFAGEGDLSAPANAGCQHMFLLLADRYNYCQSFSILSAAPQGVKEEKQEEKQVPRPENNRILSGGGNDSEDHSLINFPKKAS